MPNRSSTAFEYTSEKEVVVHVEKEESVPTYWRVYTETGEVPEAFLGSKNRSTPAYEIKIAISEGATTSGMLFNYFPTKVRFPYPVVAHATLELTSNRQNIIKSDANRFIAGKLAEVLAHVAENNVTENDVWRPLSVITARKALDPIIDELGFIGHLISASKKKKIVPIIDGTLSIPSEAKKIAVDSNDWLPQAGFGDLALWSDDSSLRETLDDLQVELLDDKQFRERVESLSESLSLGERAALISGLIRHHSAAFIPKDPLPKILVDKANSLIDSDAVVRPRVILDTV